MSGDVHVRFYEGLGVKLPGATHQADLSRSRSRSRKADSVCPISAEPLQESRVPNLCHCEIW